MMVMTAGTTVATMLAKGLFGRHNPDPETNSPFGRHNPDPNRWPIRRAGFNLFGGLRGRTTVRARVRA